MCDAIMQLRYSHCVWELLFNLKKYKLIQINLPNNLQIDFECLFISADSNSNIIVKFKVK